MTSLNFEPGTVQFNDLLSFLTRHSSIVNLELCNVIRPTAHHQPRKLLPALEKLSADPFFAVWLLDREKAFEHLMSLCLMSEDKLNEAFDYNTFDGVLSQIPRSAPYLTTLSISFYSEAGIVEWLDKHVSEEDSPVAALNSVTTLDLFPSGIRLWRREVMALIPRFVARFQGLHRLFYASPPPAGRFTYALPPVTRATQISFIKEIKRACPGVTVMIGSSPVADQPDLSQASDDTQELS